MLSVLFFALHPAFLDYRVLSNPFVHWRAHILNSLCFYLFLFEVDFTGWLCFKPGVFAVLFARTYTMSSQLCFPFANLLWIYLVLRFCLMYIEVYGMLAWIIHVFTYNTRVGIWCIFDLQASVKPQQGELIKVVYHSYSGSIFKNTSK